MTIKIILKNATKKIMDTLIWFSEGIELITKAPPTSAELGSENNPFYVCTVERKGDTND